MKKLIAICLFLSLICGLCATTPIFAATDGAGTGDEPVNEEGHYLWNFDDASLIDTAAGTIGANTGNNKMTVKTVTNPTFPEQANGSISAGWEIKAAATPGGKDLSAKLGNGLYAVGVYFELENAIELKKDAEWHIELIGQLPNGYNGTNNLPNPDTALFAGPDNEFFLSGNGTAFMFTKTVGGTETTYKMKDDDWASSFRIGQARVNSMQIWNEYNEDTQKWEIHWLLPERFDGGAEAWIGVEYSCEAPGVDFTFNSIGSLTNYFGVNWWGSCGIPFISEIEIFEDLGLYEDDVIAAIPEGMILSPVAGVAFSKTLTLGDTLSAAAGASIRWTNEAGEQKTKAAAGNTYIATVTLTPVMGFCFSEETVVPAEYTAVINEDGTMTLTKTFVLPPEETEAPATEPAAPTVTEAPTADNAPVTDAPAADEAGCASVVGGAALAVLCLSAGGVLLLKKKED